MCLSRDEYFAAVDFLNGYEMGGGGMDLNVGFHDWLVARLGISASGIAWPWLALRVIGGDELDRSGRVFPGRERELIEALGGLLLEYLDGAGPRATVPGDPAKGAVRHVP